MKRDTNSGDHESLFRGQACSLWEINSSLTRETKFLENEKELYYDILSMKPNSFENDHSVYERLITMQHYGMPTRLMDLSRNPLVAIFFACNNRDKAKEDGAIFIFKTNSNEIKNFEDPLLENLQQLYSEQQSDSIESKNFLKDLHYIRGVAKNQRINNQSGDFLFIGKETKPKDIEDEVSHIIIIDSGVKQPLLEMLEQLNIHGGSVYPDLTHMSNYIKEKFKKT